MNHDHYKDAHKIRTILLPHGWSCSLWQVRFEKTRHIQDLQIQMYPSSRRT